MTTGYKQFDITIGGDTLLLHNGQTADCMNPYSRAMKAITSDKKRKSTEEGQATLQRIEMEAGLYLDSKKRVILPSRVLEAHICAAARKTKDGKAALAGLFVDNDAILEYEGGPLSLAELLDSPDHRLVTGVKVQQNRVMRCRPMFKNWSATFRVSLLSEQADPSDLQEWLTQGGAFVGIGDYRPRYGRYELRSFEEVVARVKKAA